MPKASTTDLLIRANGSCKACGVCFYSPPSLRIRQTAMRAIYEFDCPVCAVLDPTRPTRELVEHEESP